MNKRSIFNARTLFLFLLLIASPLCTLDAQQIVVRGTVYDEFNAPLRGTTIHEDGTNNGTIANEQGKFSLTLSKFGERKIDVMFVGYHTQSFEFKGVQLPSKTDTIFQDITVHMAIDSIGFIGPHRRGYWRVYSMIIGTTVSRFSTDMSSFTELPSKYIDGFNNIEYTGDISVGGYYNSIFGLVHFRGSLNNPIESNDSIDESVNLSDVGIQFGYGFSTRGYRLVFTPYIGLDLLFYRLKTADPRDKLPLSTYLDNQYYHVTFQQWTSTLGANLDIKLFGSRDVIWGYTSMHLRMGAGYMFRLGKHPYINSPTNRLTSDGSFDMNNLYLNAGLVFYIHN